MPHDLYVFLFPKYFYDARSCLSFLVFAQSIVHFVYKTVFCLCSITSQKTIQSKSECIEWIGEVMAYTHTDLSNMQLFNSQDNLGPIGLLWPNKINHYILFFHSIFPVGPSSAAGTPKVPSQTLLSDLTADTNAYTKQNQYFDSTNMAYVLELSNRKTNQNSNVNDDDTNNSNIRNSNLRVLPNYNNNDKMNSANHNNNDNSNNHENEADEDNNSVKKKSSNEHDADTHSDNKNYFNHYQFNNGDDLEHIDGGAGSGSGSGNNPLNRGPFFDVSASKNVTALVGKMANLNCRIKNLGNKTVRIKEQERINFICPYLRCIWSHWCAIIRSMGLCVYQKHAHFLLTKYFLFSF